MRFGLVQNEKFGSIDGSYSLVTQREYEDSQITATDAEAEILVSAFGKENIHVGNVGSGREAARKEFRLYPTGERIYLNLVYPKPSRSELRLYISKSAGYKPKPNFVWFLFYKVNELWIGAMPEAEWRKENSVYRDDFTQEDLDKYLEEDDETAKRVLVSQQRFERDPRIAKRRMEISKYKCEYDPSHKLFISRFSGVPFLESHHLVPIRYQLHFPNKSLDSIHNVYCLCPYCHRAIHHAEESTARDLLSELSSRRPILAQFKLDIDELFRLYSVELITR